MDLQRAVGSPGVVNEAELPEPVHKEADTRTSRADHLSQRFLADLGNYSFGNAFLTKVSEQEQHAGQTFFARVEKLVDKVLFVTYIPPQQIRHKHFRQRRLTMKSVHHSFFLNPENLAICHCCG